jgi:hypothetical protein
LGAGSTYYSTPIDAVVTEGAGSGQTNSQPDYVDGGGIVDAVKMQAAMDAINLKLNSNQVGNNPVETYTDLSDQYIGDGNDTTIYFSAINLQANTTLTIDGNVTVITSEAMTMGAGAEIVLLEGAQVTWILGGSLNLGAGSKFSGETYVNGAVNGATSDIECGNLYATGEVSVRSVEPDACFAPVTPVRRLNGDTRGVVCPIWSADSEWEIWMAAAEIIRVEHALRLRPVELNGTIGYGFAMGFSTSTYNEMGVDAYLEFDGNVVYNEFSDTSELYVIEACRADFNSLFGF